MTAHSGAAWRPAELAACQQAIRGCLAGVRETTASLDGLLSRRNELRNELKTYRKLAVSSGFGEDLRLSRYYLRARSLLWQAPSDLTRAEGAVRDYYQAIRRRGDG